MTAVTRDKGAKVSGPCAQAKYRRRGVTAAAAALKEEKEEGEEQE